MADHTGIEWADATWNPIVGCSIVSPGCTNCYAMGQAARIERMQPGSHYAGTTQPSKAGAVWSGKLALAPDHILSQPLHWRRPRRIFVNSMGDLFHEDAPDAWIDQVFAVMAFAHWHTFMVLTKRAARMRQYLSDPGLYERVYDLHFGADWPKLPTPCDVEATSANCNHLLSPGYLRNVWLGVSTEDQRRANERVPNLLATPAAIRFVSAEPLLGPLNLFSLNERRGERGTITDWHDALRGLRFGPSEETAKLDLVIAGGESGHKARPMHPDWARSLRDQCAAAGTAFFFKQWGEWEPRRWKADGGTHAMRHTAPDWGCFQEIQSHPDSIERVEPAPDGWQAFARVGKRAAGRLLDGVEHNAMPEMRS